MKRVRDLRLVSCPPPQYFPVMVKLAGATCKVLVEEFGTKFLLERFSDPFWFQAFACFLGYEHDSSGSTTVITAALREALKRETHEVVLVGGKGKTSKKVPQELQKIGQELKLDSKDVENMISASRLCAKVDTVELQDGFSLYHHMIVLDKEMDWAVIQQGMNVETLTARRYHIPSRELNKIVETPHSGIISDLKWDTVLDLTAKESKNNRKMILEILKETSGEGIIKDIKRIAGKQDEKQIKLTKWIKGENQKIVKENFVPKFVLPPKRVRLENVKKLKSVEAENFAELLLVEGAGPSIIRGLAYVAELVYGADFSRKDPSEFNFAFGSKSGRPYPVKPNDMIKTAEILERAVEKAKIDEKNKMRGLERLRRFIK
ncbi:MAG: DUF763 domain-containing protein [Candidatus Hodarchaeota archaeon]